MLFLHRLSAQLRRAVYAVEVRLATLLPARSDGNEITDLHRDLMGRIEVAASNSDWKTVEMHCDALGRRAPLPVRIFRLQNLAAIACSRLELMHLAELLNELQDLVEEVVAFLGPEEDYSRDCQDTLDEYRRILRSESLLAAPREAEENDRLEEALDFYRELCRDEDSMCRLGALYSFVRVVATLQPAPP